MSLWGNKDTVYSTGNITTITDAGVITGSGTTFTDSTLVSSGMMITLGSKGGGVIKSVDSNTQLTLHSTAGLTTGTGLTQTYNISEAPKSSALDSNTNVNEVYGSNAAEVAAASGTIYEHSHAGWVGITTYVDTHGNTRTKTEVLVAMSSIAGDAADDSILADS
jgi:hypothetical protein